MYDRVIVASGNRDLLRAWKDICESLRDDLTPGYQVGSCRYADDAKQLWQQNKFSRDLVIVDRTLPASDSPEAVRSLLGGGVDLVRDLQAEEPAPACILMGLSDNRIATIGAKWPLWGMLTSDVPEQADMIGDIKKMAEGLASKRDAVRGAGPVPLLVLPSAKPWALLDVHLDGEHHSRLILKIGDGTRNERKYERPIQFKMTDLQDVVERSRALKKKISDCLNDPLAWSNYVGQWRRDYEDLGRSVHTLINRDGFEGLWARASEAAKENVRLRFVLDESAYDGLWESIFNPQDEWLMLKSTIARCARTITSAEHLYRLDRGDGTVNMLAIASNVPDNSVVKGTGDEGWRIFWNGFYSPLAKQFKDKWGRFPRLNEVLAPLPDLQREMAQLKTLETPTSLATLKIKFLPDEERAPGESLREQTKRWLTKNKPSANGSPRFDVVHFAGHAIFRDDDIRNRGYLVFGDDPHTDLVPVSEFAHWLREAGVQMVYLSCCRSSAARAAFELADAGIPLTIGFTWDLDSGKAADFAKEFYDELLKNDLKVCNAFQGARRTLSDRHRDGDPIWTSPVLVAQPEDWLSVERYLASVH